MAPRVTIRRKKKSGVQLTVPTGPTRVKVGYPTGVSSSILDRATWNHFGTQNIPERPFIANAMRDNRGKYLDDLATSARKIVRGQVSTRAVLAKLGILAQGDVQLEITTLADPPNAASTIARKGSSNPLIDTGEMRAATTWKIDT